MGSVRYRTGRQVLKQAALRRLFITSIVFMLAVIFSVSMETPNAMAAPVSATIVRQDRRPDRERPVTTSQGSNSGTSQSSSSSSSRPRLIRR